jgi:hypothetical protein
MVTKIILKKHILRELLLDQEGYLASLVALPPTLGAGMPHNP